MSSGRRDVSLLRRALRYERDTGEVSSIVGMCACVSWSTHPNLRKYPFFPSPSLFFDRYSVPGIGYRYLSLSLLRQTIQWMADRLKAHDRLTRGWEDIHCQGSEMYAAFVRCRSRKETIQCAIHLLRAIDNNVKFASIVLSIATATRY